jgi:hypothetical protein
MSLNNSASSVKIDDSLAVFRSQFTSPIPSSGRSLSRLESTMTRAEEEAASTQFLRALLENTTKEGADAAEVEYMVERLVPVLVPGSFQ